MNRLFTTILTILFGWIGASGVFAGEASPVVSKAKQAAEAKGFVFLTNRDEIVAKAKKEGKLRISVNMEVPTLKAASKAFNQKYPFINLHAQEITGIDMVQRNVL